MVVVWRDLFLSFDLNEIPVAEKSRVDLWERDFFLLNADPVECDFEIVSGLMLSLHHDIDVTGVAVFAIITRGATRRRVMLANSDFFRWHQKGIYTFIFAN